MSPVAPVKYPAGFFGVFTGSYDLEAAYCHMTAVYTNKAPGGVAYACSFRITEAVYFVERLVDCLAFDLKIDPAELRLMTHDQSGVSILAGWAVAQFLQQPALNSHSQEVLRLQFLFEFDRGPRP